MNREKTPGPIGSLVASLSKAGNGMVTNYYWAIDRKIAIYNYDHSWHNLT